MHHEIGKTLIAIGLVIALVGVIIHFGGKLLPLGHLPGDLSWHGKNWSVHFPLASSIIISILLTVIANIFFRR